MTDFNENEDIAIWLNEEFPLDNNIQTDEELSDDEDVDGEVSSNDFIFHNTDHAESTEETLNSYKDVSVVFDDNIDLGLPTIQEPIAISIPTTLPGPSSSTKPLVKKTKKKLLEISKKKSIISDSTPIDVDETEESYEPNRKWSKINKSTSKPNYCLPTGPVEELFLR